MVANTRWPARPRDTHVARPMPRLAPVISIDAKYHLLVNESSRRSDDARVRRGTGTHKTRAISATAPAPK
jgi:hypothetical protein